MNKGLDKYMESLEMQYFFCKLHQSGVLTLFFKHPKNSSKHLSKTKIDPKYHERIPRLTLFLQI